MIEIKVNILYNTVVEIIFKEDLLWKGEEDLKSHY